MDFAKLAESHSDNDIDGMRRILWAVSKAIRLLKPFEGASSIDPEVNASLDKQLFYIAFSKLSGQSQSQYMETGFDESLRQLIHFLRETAPVMVDVGGGGGKNLASNNHNNTFICNYCKQPGHSIAGCSALKVG